MTLPQPISVDGLLYEIDDLLIDLLSRLGEEEWEAQTIAPLWTVKDVALHLLDGNLRALSMLRDGQRPPPDRDISSYSDLVGYLNQLNADWIKATRRLSPRVIIDLLQSSGREYCDFISSLAPQEPATFSVAWAGEEESKNWFHVAREYTEKWHHQQQIRLATSKDDILLQEKWYLPYLDTSVRALPHHYRNVPGNEGDLIEFSFKGDFNKSWYLTYEKGWSLYCEVEKTPHSSVHIPNEIAWRIFTKGIPRDEAISLSKTEGRKDLGFKIFDMLAVMA
jgi:hypothetical protein